MTNPKGRRGLSLMEVIVVLVLLALFALFVIMALPRQRETQRFAECEMNLRQFGVALALYDQPAGDLPTVVLGTPDGSGSGASPHFALLDQLGLASFRELDETKPLPPRPAHW